MSFRVVVDSCCEVPENLLEDDRIVSVPLGLQVGDTFFVDDEKLVQRELLEHIAAYEGCPKSSCPSPEAFMEAYHCDAERVYVITLSSKLSGSYNAAVLGKELYKETYGDKKIHVVDSHSASAGMSAQLLEIFRLEEQGLSFEEVSAGADQFRDKHVVYFVLDNLETLRKNGRLSTLKAVIASTMKIKPICKGDQGEIAQTGQAIGNRKALSKMVESVLAEAARNLKNTVECNLVIAHCNCRERAEYVKGLFESRAQYKAIYINDTRGLSSLYANDGGIIVSL